MPPSDLSIDRCARASMTGSTLTPGPLTGGDWPSTLRVVRARTRRRGSRGRRRPDPTGVCERTRQAHQDAAEQTRGSAAGDRGRGARQTPVATPLRELYDLRHTYDTFALPARRAGVRPLKDTSVAIIDLHYGHVTTAMRTPSRSSMRSRSSGRWTLGGRRTGGA